MEPKCKKATSFLFIMNKPKNPSMRRSKIAKSFRDLHLKEDDHELLITLRRIWKIAVGQPDDGEFPSLGIFQCMAKLIDRGIKDKNWISRSKNMLIPYYAAHIIGTYTMNKAELADIAVKSGVIPPLMELLRGKMSWIEQRVAVRALGHIANHRRTFKTLISSVHEEEIVKLTMEIASTCLNTVYLEYLNLKCENRLEYHRDLITRSGVEMEERKAEEWGIQLQCWSLYLLNCFVTKKRCIHLICNKEFLHDLCGMWGGLVNIHNSSFSGVSLIRSLCLSQEGRKRIASSREVIENLCHLSRSSDEWQMKAIESLLLLLKDKETRYEVMNISSPFLVDLVEFNNGKRTKVGDIVTQVLLQDYGSIKYRQLVLKEGSRSKKSEKVLEEVWNLKVERRKRDEMMSEEEFRERKLLVAMLKREGNQKFWCGEIEEAVEKYTKGLDLCPLKMKKERIVLYSNRAQCYLLVKEAESAIRDTTRALCLSGVTAPHVKSLWRRSQAYDMKGLARQSLMDCLMFVNQRSKLKGKKVKIIPYYAVRMLNKQINATNLFDQAGRRKSSIDESRHEDVSASQRRNESHEADMAKDRDHNKKFPRKINKFLSGKI